MSAHELPELVPGLKRPGYPLPQRKPAQFGDRVGLDWLGHAISKRPDIERPYRAFGYPVVPVLYIVAAVAIMLVLILYKTQTTWPGLLIVVLGAPVYMFWSRR